MDRNLIGSINRAIDIIKVALRKESVDRNHLGVLHMDRWLVALRKESVDRNGWSCFRLRRLCGVALRKESVDRNLIGCINRAVNISRSPQGERG